LFFETIEYNINFNEEKIKKILSENLNNENLNLLKIENFIFEENELV